MAPIKAIAGVVPHPGTTFPWPLLPMDLSRLPIAVFCPMVRIGPQLIFQSLYSMANAASEVEPVERFNAICL